MPDTIKDGSGHGYLASVNSKNRLLVRATVVEQRLKASIDGDYYEMYTDVITITNASETPLIYLENLDRNGRVIIVDRVFVDTWESTGGTAGGKLEYYINPSYTGGTIVNPINTRFDDQTIPEGTFLKSPTTLTGTEWWQCYITKDGASTVIEEGRIVIPPGRSFGFSLVPPAGNTSMKININVAFYYLDLHAVGEVS